MTEQTQITYYEVLHVATQATQQEIKAARDSLLKKYHPDLDEEISKWQKKDQQVKEAWKTLKDETKRKRYDQKLKGLKEHSKGKKASKQTKHVVKKSASVETQMNYYKVLKLARKATQKQIKESYTKLKVQLKKDIQTKQKHLNKKIKQINKAWGTLGNKGKKEKYDKKLMKDQKRLLGKKTKARGKKLDYAEEESKNWQGFKTRYKNEKTWPYNPRKDFDSKIAIQHKTFGLGFIISNYNNRIQVLFKDGEKVLISNHK